MNKEQIYDEKIAPLMAELIKVAEEAQIAMFATFVIPTPEDPDLMCSTCTTDETGDNPLVIKKLLRAAGL